MGSQLQCVSKNSTNTASGETRSSTNTYVNTTTTTTTTTAVTSQTNNRSQPHCANANGQDAQTLSMFEKFMDLYVTLIRLLTGRNSGTQNTGRGGAAAGDICDHKPTQSQPKQVHCEPKPVQCDPKPDCNTVVKTKEGKIWGDPHFVGADGGKYDIQGEPGKTYNILSDNGIQFNARFDNKESKDGATFVYDTGFTINGHQVQFNKEGDLNINGDSVGDGTYLGGAIVKEGNTLTVKTSEYEICVHAKGNSMDIDLSSDNVNADGIMPHGLWGQTADGDGVARSGDKGKGAQGGGAIEGFHGMTEKGDKHSVKAYETRGLFDTNFSNFNKYA